MFFFGMDFWGFQNLLSASCVEHLDFVMDFDMESIDIEPLKDIETSSDIKLSELDLQDTTCVVETDKDFEMRVNILETDRGTHLRYFWYTNR